MNPAADSGGRLFQTRAGRRCEIRLANRGGRPSGGVMIGGATNPRSEALEMDQATLTRQEAIDIADSIDVGSDGIEDALSYTTATRFAEMLREGKPFVVEITR